MQSAQSQPLNSMYAHHAPYMELDNDFSCTHVHHPTGQALITPKYHLNMARMPIDVFFCKFIGFIDLSVYIMNYWRVNRLWHLQNYICTHICITPKLIQLQLLVHAPLRWHSLGTSMFTHALHERGLHLYQITHCLLYLLYVTNTHV